MDPRLRRELRDCFPNSYVAEDVALVYHLICKHDPPVPPVLIGIAKQALQLALLGEFEATLTLPDGSPASVRRVVTALHLHDLLAEDAL